MEDTKDKISLKNEILRKTIHLSSSIIPVSYFYLPGNIEIIILCVISVVMVSIDITRTRIPLMTNLYLKFLQPVLRTHEIQNQKPVFSGGTYLVLAYLICVIIFPKPVAITSMFIIIISDSIAAIFGKVYGKHFVGNKTIEGSLAFFLSAILILLLSPKLTDLNIEYYTGIASAFLTSVFELLPIKIDDNITIPLFFGTVYYLLLKIFV